MKSRKATHGQLRRDNRQLLLRGVYTGLASSRAELAQETGLAKPTVSDLISELIDEGFLIETGLGQSTDEGGKRPRLLKFVPNARHVIGISINADRISGVLANLEGQVLVQHFKTVSGEYGQAAINSLYEVINGLFVQLDAPLLCIGIGVPGLADTRAGIVRYAPHLGWQDISLAAMVNARFQVPVYLANGTELAALAQFAFSNINGINSLATVLVDDSVGVGVVLDGAIYHTGGEIGQLRTTGYNKTPATNGSGEYLETFLGWPSVKSRAATFIDTLPAEDLTYLNIRRAIIEQHPAALALQDELASYLAQVFAWIIGLLRPDHISLSGSIADLGESFLERAVRKTQRLILPDLMKTTAFSLDNSSNLVAIGAVAQTLQLELGLV